MNKKQVKKLRVLNNLKLRENVDYDVEVKRLLKFSSIDKDGNVTEEKVPRYTITLKEGSDKHKYRQLKKENRTTFLSLKEAYAASGKQRTKSTTSKEEV